MDIISVQDKAVSTAASMTVYCSLRSRKRPPLASVLALGDPVTPLPEDRLEETGELAREVKTLYNAPQSALLLRESATAANFQKKCGAVSIATSGLSRAGGRPHSIRLVAESHSHAAKPLWAFRRVANHAPALECAIGRSLRLETGLGEDNLYEGIQGLPRAFQTAGAANVLMTLWAVNAKTTPRIVSDFYCAYKKGPKGATLSEALRTAQIHAIKANIKPRYWASLSLDGAGD